MDKDTVFEAEKELDDAYVMHTFARKPVEFVRGQDCRLYDSAGREYIDFLAGIGVVSVGHCNPKVNAAVAAQLDKLVHVGNYFYIEHRGELARRISQMLAGTSGATWRTFFANSGAEANEGALKLARLWGKRHLDGAQGIITAKKSFHGRTAATLAATGQPELQAPFQPLPGGFMHVPLNDIPALEAALDAEAGGTKPCAVMLECIQGESGVWPCSREYLQAVRRLTEERGMLLILDEVQTGFCRTGEYFAFQAYGIEPDIVSMAKGIADGIPMGAFAAPEAIAQLMEPGMHGSTFGGSNIACAAADATTELMRADGFLSHVREVGAYLREKLAGLPFVAEVRGAGLMVGITLEERVAARLVSVALEHGFVLNAPAADIIRLLPPLTIGKEGVDALVGALPQMYEEACR